MNALKDQRGFTVVETLLATVLLVALGIGTLGLLGTFARAVGNRSSASNGGATAESMLVSMRSDAATAFAVFVPTNDVFGKANTNNATGLPPHEFDYYSKAEDGTESWWAYTYDPLAGTVRRWDYEPGASPTTNIVGVLDRHTGAIDTLASYPAITGVKAFSAHTLEATELTSTANTFSPLISQLVSAAGVAPLAEPVGFVPSSKASRPDLYGGNTTVEVSLITSNTTRTFHLATEALPSGFTVHAAPSIRAFAYRLDYGHRFWFGFAQKTWARVFEQLQYSYTPKVTGTWKVWCDYEVYGSNSNGLALNDPNASYNPKSWIEATAGEFYKTTQSDLSQLNPNGCGKKIPAKNSTSATPGPLAGTPDVVDTPPPCFTAGTCWPQGAPVDWSPPSPWPAQSAPPQWCATHNLSTLCGGPGNGGQDQNVDPNSPSPNPDLTSYPAPTPTPDPYHFSPPPIRPTIAPVHVGGIQGL